MLAEAHSNSSDIGNTRFCTKGMIPSLCGFNSRGEVMSACRWRRLRQLEALRWTPQSATRSCGASSWALSLLHTC